MKSIISIVLILLAIISCNSTKNIGSNSNDIANTNTSDTIKIANDSLEYEILIIDPGFNSWLLRNAFPRGYHSINYLETKNRMYVTEWNSRVLNRYQFNPDLYMMSIDYNPTIRYGYEVNYLLYNYFIYFQNSYNQKLRGFVPNR